MCNSEIRNVEEIPHPYRDIFNEYPCFNAVQSQVLDAVLYTDDSVVVSAPTGAGKTVIFELAIIRLLICYENVDISQQLKMVYICPIKSLCQERLVDWHVKFSKFGINCISVTGDSDYFDFHHLINHNLIISTPEKWDSLTRKWKDNEKIVKVVKLFMIDEVHLLNEENRGSTLEVIVSRMKTVEDSVTSYVDECGNRSKKIRFIALSATVPNVEDIAEWIGKPPKIKFYKFSEEMRPVKLKKIVLGYNCNPKTTSPFKFDISLNYKLQSLMMQYSEGKPTLIFCSTRKSVEMTANHIVKSLRIHLNEEQTNKLMEVANLITDVKARGTIKHGVGYHHAGLIPETRHVIENLFRKGDLPVLVTTSTLAMGVNLPAHLVIVKSTKCYDNCGFRDYTETAIHQMIGRAGRPQFDTSATALILTTSDDKHKFEKMVGCGQPIESNLHRHLTEHLNAEVVLRTITDLVVAMQWLASTFLYVRARKNPRHYGLNVGLREDQLDKKLLEMCQIDLNKLVTAGMITMDQNFLIAPTSTGEIMAKYYVAFETMKLFTQISGTEILIQILALISKCHEFSEMRLRVNDKKTLNLFNKNSKRTTIRFPLNGRIKTWDMKVNCIIQAVLGNLDILDHSLLSESFTIMRNGARIAKCLSEYLGTRRQNCYSALLNTVILCKCFHAKLWENSPYVSKQLSGIGSVMSHQLVNSGKTTFKKILNSNPRDIELNIKRKPPMGNLLIEEVRHIPQYEMTLEKTNNPKQLKLTISLLNGADLQETSTINVKSIMTLLVGNNLNEILVYERYQHSVMMENTIMIKYISINTQGLEEVDAHFISEDWVGIDCNSSLTFAPTDEIANAEMGDDGKNSNKKGPTYIQMFLDMYMKTKKKGTEVTQKKQKVKKDETLPSKEAIKEPKKLVQKTDTKTTNKLKVNDMADKNTLQESKKTHEDIAAVPTNNESNSDPKVLTTSTVQPQNTNEDNTSLGLNYNENEILDDISNSSSTSLFSNKLSETIFNSHLDQIHDSVRRDMHIEQNDEDDHHLVIDEKQADIKENTIVPPKDMIDFEEKVKKAPSLFHLSQKYNINRNKPAAKRKVCKRKTDVIGAGMEYVTCSGREDASKRPSLEEFKFPNKKQCMHQPNLDNIPDSTEGSQYYGVANNNLDPSNMWGVNFEHKSANTEDKPDKNKENAQKSITWRSPLVFSPAAKFSPKVNFQNCGVSRDEVETDTQNEITNETFETTSSKSAANLTINIQRTPRPSQNAACRFVNKKRGTQFPLRDRDYLLNSQQDDALDICSPSLMEMLGMDKSNQNTSVARSKKVEASPTVNYYSQLLAKPVQVQKQHTEATTASQKELPDNKHKENKENKQNHPCINNLKVNSPKSRTEWEKEAENARNKENAQNDFNELECSKIYQRHFQNPEMIHKNLNSPLTIDTRKKLQDTSFYASPYDNFIMPQKRPVVPEQYASYNPQSSLNRTLDYPHGSAYLNPRSSSTEWNRNPRFYGNFNIPELRADCLYEEQNLRSKYAGFFPQNAVESIPNIIPPQLNKTFMSNNYQDPSSLFTSQNRFPPLPVSNPHREEDSSRLPPSTNYNYHLNQLKRMAMNQSILPANLGEPQLVDSAQYFEDNLKNVNQSFCEKENCDCSLNGSRPQCIKEDNSTKGNVSPNTQDSAEDTNQVVSAQIFAHHKAIDEKHHNERATKHVNDSPIPRHVKEYYDRIFLQRLKHQQREAGVADQALNQSLSFEERHGRNNPYVPIPDFTQAWDFLNQYNYPQTPQFRTQFPSNVFSIADEQYLWYLQYRNAPVNGYNSGDKQYMLQKFLHSLNQQKR